ncbi:hypothetical protein ACLQ3K_12960 [Tsukamurella sp. DT100]|uniref:Rv0361 family membrane protein n=1 Tax=Tsukamurella sp. DT100 TaxID=3393415 RepID=UPI003CEC0772
MSADKAPAGPPPERRTTATPFIIALVVAVVLIGGVLAWNAIRPSDERLSDSAQVQVTIGQYYGALNKGRYADLVANTCAKDRSAADFPKEAGFPDARKAVVEREGEAKLDEKGVKNLTVNGDSASADLTVTYEKAGERTEQAKFVREDGKWKKCS